MALFAIRKKTYRCCVSIYKKVNQQQKNTDIKNLAHVCAELIMRNEPPLTSYLLPKQNELRRT